MSPPSDSAISAAVAAALAMLQRGKTTEAEAALHALAATAPGAARVLHALGVVKLAQRDLNGALPWFSEACAAPDASAICFRDLAHAALQHGATGEAEAALRAGLARFPDAHELRFRLAEFLLVRGAASLAKVEAERLIAAQPTPKAWRVLAHAKAGEQDWIGARAAIEQALQGAPSPTLARERAVILDEMNAPDALQALAQAAASGADSPDLTARRARALHGEGRWAEAEATLADGLRHWSDNIQLHAALARIRWLRGAGGASTEAIAAAAAAQPDNAALRVLWADFERAIGRNEDAAAILEDGLRRTPDSPALAAALGAVLDGMGRVGDAAALLRAAAQRAPSPQIDRSLMATLLRAGAPEEALRLIAAARARAPDDQQLIAYEATASRMLARPDYAALHDYQRLVRRYAIEPPAGFASTAEFNAALAARLRTLHRAERHPLDQSLRGGTQTDRSLPADDPVIGAFMDFATRSAADYAARLDAASAHPTDRRKADGVRIAASWSVRLQAGGKHLNHVHPAGWLSSAYYVELPEEMANGAGHAGWLKFGEPSAPIAGCDPDLFVRPEAGMLVLFPSYLWHGTEPHIEGGDRLTVAFDVLPRL